MKKIIVILMVIAMALTSLVGCQGNDGGNGGEGQLGNLEKIQEKGVLTMGTSAGYPPFEFYIEVDGQPEIVGFDIEIAKEIAADMGVELEIIDMQFEGLLPALMGNRIDIIIAGMTPTEERQKSVDFSMVYYDPQQSMLVKAGREDELNTIESFSGKILGVQKASIQEEMAKEVFQESDIKAIARIPNLIMELKTDKIDGLLLSEPVANSYARTNEDLVALDIGLGSEGGAAIAIQKGKEDVLEVINDTLSRLIESGKIDEFILEATLLSENQ